MLDKIKAALFGLSVGDALGVPVEFLSREEISKKPVTDMFGHGSHNQPAGTFSDDSSLAFCLAESLCRGYHINDIANNFVNWYQHNFWTAHGNVFGVGIATSSAIWQLANGDSPLTSGGAGEGDNGNGSLMRILPIIFYTKDLPITERYSVIQEVSGITHRHQRSVIACFIYTEFALQLLAGLPKQDAYLAMQKTVNEFLFTHVDFDRSEIDKFHRILENPINNYNIYPLDEYEENEIHSSGYVLHTLEASLWCILKTNSYQEAVLKAVNLGSDTDTTACVTGGLAGLLYGYNAIPDSWLAQLARNKDINDLCERLAARLSNGV
jgi:ADP-ribosyl-[dinitrogen reductase] hydrolase